MGGSNFSSSYRSTPSTSSTNWSRSSFSSSPIRGSPVQVNTFLFPSYGFGFGGGSSLFTLLFYAFAAYTLFTVIRSFTQQDWADGGDYYDEEESVSERASVCKVQVGLLGLARNLQRDLDSLARRADTSSPEGLQYLLQETLLALNRNPDYCVYGASEVKRARNIERAETGFNAISMKERGKIKEETLSNWEGRRKETQTTIAKSQIGNELIVVTILVASVGTLQLPTVRSKDDLRTALNRLGAIRSRDLLALEVLWTPQDENDSYTPDELVADYPELSDYFKIHWSLHNEEDSNSASIDTSIEAKTKGWASLAFAKIKGRMHPADAALGWIREDGHHHQQAYHIVEDDIHESNANASLLEVKSISREGDWLFIDFVKIEKSGLVAVDLDEDVFLNYAIGKENALKEHNKYGSVVISFTTGEIHTASFRKYYQVHGALMIIAWIALIPLAILIARSRWAPSGMGKRGWLDLHKGIQVFVVICVFCALLIALINFQPIESKKGRMHRLVGILTSILLAIQVLAGIFRPSLEHELRPIFNVAHAWSGRCLALLAVISVFLGISAFHHTTHSSIVTWVSVIIGIRLLE
eukprot:g5151.t1